uniref:Putative secreted protein n=1 Tax=Ixodes ricinus TaxID=34613 RepID=A0A6B0UPX6_IXORI
MTRALCVCGVLFDHTLLSGIDVCVSFPFQIKHFSCEYSCCPVVPVPFIVLVFRAQLLGARFRLERRRRRRNRAVHHGKYPIMHRAERRRGRRKGRRKEEGEGGGRGGGRRRMGGGVFGRMRS